MITKKKKKITDEYEDMSIPKLIQIKPLPPTIYILKLYTD